MWSSYRAGLKVTGLLMLICRCVQWEINPQTKSSVIFSCNQKDTPAHSSVPSLQHLADTLIPFWIELLKQEVWVLPMESLVDNNKWRTLNFASFPPFHVLRLELFLRKVLQGSQQSRAGHLSNFLKRRKLVSEPSILLLSGSGWTVGQGTLLTTGLKYQTTVV